MKTIIDILRLRRRMIDLLPVDLAPYVIFCGEYNNPESNELTLRLPEKTPIVISITNVTPNGELGILYEPLVLSQDGVWIKSSRTFNIKAAMDMAKANMEEICHLIPG